MTGPARIGCFVTVMFTHVVVGALASRHLRAANPPQDSLAPLPSLPTIMMETDDAMNIVPACQNPDRYFAESMIPHHQGAVRMAQWELKYGSNAQLLNISQSIVTSQSEEIKQMQTSLTMVPGCTSSSASSPSMVMAPGMEMGSSGMGMQMSMESPGMGMQMGMMSPGGMLSEATSPNALTPSEAAFVNSMSSMMAPMPAPLTGNPDRDFALEMSQHHQAAIDMANVELTYGSDQGLMDMAREIIASQTGQLAEFKDILSEQYAVSA